MSSNMNQPPFGPPPFSPNPYGQPANPGLAGSSPMGYPPTEGKPIEEPKKKSGCTCVGCLLGCFGVTLVLLIVGAIGGWMLLKRVPDMARDIAHQAVDESDLPPDDKQVVKAQVDRLIQGYKDGKVSMEKLGQLAENFVESPLMDLMMAYAAKVQYIDESGLTDEEKAAAERTIQRVARGVIEEKIDKGELDVALNQISNDLGNGSRQFREEVSDEELRAFLAECKRLADEAEIPDEEYKVDIGEELKKLVDEALGESTAEIEPAAEAAPPAGVAPPAEAVPPVEAAPPAEVSPQAAPSAAEAPPALEAEKSDA